MTRSSISILLALAVGCGGSVTTDGGPGTGGDDAGGGSSGSGALGGGTGVGGAAGTVSAGGSAGTSSATCAGRCGSVAPSPGSDPGCYCDDACATRSPPDCCADKATECPSTPTPVCKKLCCSPVDCPSGHTCAAFDVAKGSFGVCVVGALEKTAGGAYAAAAAPVPVDAAADGFVPLTGSGPGFPPGCIAGAGKNGVGPCNPLLNLGCDSASGEACDWGAPGGNGLACFAGNHTAKPGAACGPGSECLPTYHCSI